MELGPGLKQSLAAGDAGVGALPLSLDLLVGLAEGPLTVPALGSGVPLPRSFWGGSLMFAMLAGYRMLKSRSARRWPGRPSPAS